MTDVLLAWMPKSGDIENTSLAYADRVLRLVQDAQRACFSSSREMVAEQARLLAVWGEEKNWPNALVEAARSVEALQADFFDLHASLGKIAARGFDDAIRHAHEQRQLLADQAGHLHRRIQDAAPGTSEAVAAGIGAWMQMLGQKSQETARISAQVASLTEAVINAARQQRVAA